MYFIKLKKDAKVWSCSHVITYYLVTISWFFPRLKSFMILLSYYLDLSNFLKKNFFIKMSFLLLLLLLLFWFSSLTICANSILLLTAQNFWKYSKFKRHKDLYKKNNFWEDCSSYLYFIFLFGPSLILNNHKTRNNLKI